MPENSNNVSYRYTRGKYSCVVTIVGGDHCVYSDIKFPLNTPDEVVNRLLDDAERESFKKLEEEKWTG